MALNFLIVVVAAVLGGWLAFSRRLARSTDWRATVTPLASIMGSGFLVSAPLLGGAVGSWAVVCMAGLLAVAYGVGGAIRFNIRHFEPIEAAGRGPGLKTALLSRIVLAGAYFISVTYYLQLLAAFVLNALQIDTPILAPTITSALLLVITGIGMWRGLGMMEQVEKYAVALNLGMIGALLVALAVHNLQLMAGGTWALPAIDSTVDFGDVRVLLGLLIVVQGFETSRYLGEEHPAEQRIATMRRAQLLSAAIYLVFIGLTTVLFHDGLGADVTAIVQLTAPVALVLPILLSVAAIGSQFSAAVADCEGAGGLVEDLTRARVSIRHVYMLILAVSVTLTWVTNVNSIIAYASRAFALYYLLQCCVAWQVARGSGDSVARRIGFALLAALCLAVVVLGIPAG